MHFPKKAEKVCEYFMEEPKSRASYLHHFYKLIITERNKKLPASVSLSLPYLVDPQTKKND